MISVSLQLSSASPSSFMEQKIQKKWTWYACQKYCKYFKAAVLLAFTTGYTVCCDNACDFKILFLWNFVSPYHHIQQALVFGFWQLWARQMWAPDMGRSCLAVCHASHSALVIALNTWTYSFSNIYVRWFCKFISHERLIYECIAICARDTNVPLGTVLVSDWKQHALH